MSADDGSEPSQLARPSRLWNRLANEGRRQRWLAPAAVVALLVVAGVALARSGAGRGWSLGMDGASQPAVPGSGRASGVTGKGPGPGDPMGPTLTLDDFLIQLAPREDDRYVRFAVALELADENARVAAVQRVTRIRAAVLETMTDFTADDLHGSDGVDKLKRELRARIRQLLGDGVRAVYLVKFGVV